MGTVSILMSAVLLLLVIASGAHASIPIHPCDFGCLRYNDDSGCAPGAFWKSWKCEENEKEIYGPYTDCNCKCCKKITGFTGPYANIWDDGQSFYSCKSIQNYEGDLLACQSQCANTTDCTAINYNPDTNNCTLSKCPRPVPSPQWNNPPWQGYSLLLPECPNGFSGPYYDYCFKSYANTMVNYSTAESHCESLGYGASLPYPNDGLRDRQYPIKGKRELFSKDGLGHWQAAIVKARLWNDKGAGWWSAAKLHPDGEWRWPYGVGVLQSAWYPSVELRPGIPSNPSYPHGYGDCTLVRGSDSLLIDIACRYTFNILCQVTASNSELSTSAPLEPSTPPPLEPSTPAPLEPSTPAPLEPSTECSGEFIGPYNGYYFSWNKKDLNHDLSEKYCDCMNATLPYPVAELDDWQAAITEAHKVIKQEKDLWAYWTAAIPYPDGVWRWPDGSDVLPASWTTSIPRHWCAMVRGENGLIRSKPCENTENIICQVTSPTLQPRPPTPSTPAPPEPSTECPGGFTGPYNGYCFSWNHNQLNYDSAKEYCNIMEATLPYPIAGLDDWKAAIARAPIYDWWSYWTATNPNGCSMIRPRDGQMFNAENCEQSRDIICQVWAR